MKGPSFWRMRYSFDSNECALILPLRDAPNDVMALVTQDGERFLQGTLDVEVTLDEFGPPDCP